jgi:predicted transcriptional regulator
MVIGQASPFGSWTRTRVLLALQLLEDSYPRQLARLLGLSISGVLKGIRSLELDGLIAGRTVGTTRIFQINPRYFAVSELRAYLARLADADELLRERVATIRRRPRRTGKPL